MSMRLPSSLALVLAMAVTVACGDQGGQPQDRPEGALGTVQQPLTCSGASSSSCVLTTYDGYSIFRRTCSDNGSFYTKRTTADVCCQQGTTGCRYTGMRWQCVEWARRYMWKKWGHMWPNVNGAQNMCANLPTKTKLVQKPVPGDVVVYGASACLQKSSSGSCIVRADATYGHVGVVVGKPSSTKWRVKDQNGPQNAHNDYLRAASKCYVHALNNPRCWPGNVKTVADTACASGSATQTCTSSKTWGAKTCIPVAGSDAGAAGAGGTAGVSGSGGANASGGASGATSTGGASGATSTGGASGASGSTAGTGGSISPDSGAGNNQPKTRVISNQQGGCSVGPVDDEPSGVPLMLLGLALGLAGFRRDREKRR